MAHGSRDGLRIEVLRSVAEAAGVTMAPGTDQFEGDALDGDRTDFIPESLIVDISAPSRHVSMDAGNYSRSWARPLFRDTFPEKQPKTAFIKLWLTGRRGRTVPT